MYWLVLTLYFAAFALLAHTLLSVLWPKTTVLSQQLQFYESSFRAAHVFSDESETAPAGWRERLKSLLIGSVSRGRPVDFIQKRLDAAGLTIEWTEFVYYHVLGAIGTGVLVYLLAGLGPALPAVGVAAWLPVAALDYLAARRRSLFKSELPETLTMISASLKAGYSLLQAVDMVAQETAPPMSVEFKKVLGDARLGLPVEAALEKMAQRVSSVSFDWMILAVKIQREVGGNLSEVLSTLARTIRERNTVKRQIKVLTAEGRLSALILLCLPVFITIVLYLLNPTYMRLMFTTGAGLAMVALAAALMAIGAFWLWRIIQIEV